MSPTTTHQGSGCGEGAENWGGKQHMFSIKRGYCVKGVGEACRLWLNSMSFFLVCIYFIVCSKNDELKLLIFTLVN